MTESERKEPGKVKLPIHSARANNAMSQAEEESAKGLAQREADVDKRADLMYWEALESAGFNPFAKIVEIAENAESESVQLDAAKHLAGYLKASKRSKPDTEQALGVQVVIQHFEREDLH